MVTTTEKAVSGRLDLACANCKRLCQFARTICMEGDGPEHAEILLVGEAPGEKEDLRGRAFVGRAGNYLKNVCMERAGIDDEDITVRFTNAVRCRPPKNKAPTLREIENCYPHLKEEIKQVKPKVVMLLGNAPLHSIIKPNRQFDDFEKRKQAAVTGISRWRGKVLWSQEFSCWVIPTWHPSGAMRDSQEGMQYKTKQLVEDLKTALKLTKQSRPQQPEIITSFVDDSTTAKKVLTYLFKQPRVALDIETTGFDPRNDDLLGIAFAASREKGYYITWDAIEGSPATRMLFESILMGHGPDKILHNVGFDEKFLRLKNLPFGGQRYDTMIMASLVDENFSKGLKQLTWRWLTFGGYEDELDQYRIEHRLRSFRGIPPDILGRYAPYDAVATFQLFELFSEKLKKEKTYPLFEKILTPVRVVMTDAEVEGFPIDLQRAEELDTKCTAAYDRIIRKVVERADRANFNPNSRQQLARLLYEDLKLKPLKQTNTGRSSVDKASLEFVAKQKRGEIAQWLLDALYVKSMQTKFVRMIIKNCWEDDSRIHTRYNLTGTVTGRTSCSDPGIHNIPRDALIRSLFIAKRGHVLVYGDIKSAELRMLAEYSGEPALLRAFTEGRDLHDETYRIMFNKSDDYKPTSDERFIAKAINFGLIYGRGAKSLARTIGVSEEEAQRLIRIYFKKLPKAKAWLDRNKEIAERRGYVASLFKRRRRLPELETDDYAARARAFRQANNSVIQSAAADYTYILMVRIAKGIKDAGLKAKIVHTVHDCVIVRTPKSEVKQVLAIFEKAYKTPIKAVHVKMEVDVKVVQNWGEEASQEKEGSRLFKVLSGGHDITEWEKLKSDRVPVYKREVA